MRRESSNVAEASDKTKTEARMERKLEDLEPGSPRYETLRSAIRFKKSWLDLAKRLSALAKSNDYREWGYRTLEAYAQHELHLRRDTTQKLLRSYGFLAEHEKETLESTSEDAAPPLPSYQALDVLAEARNNPYLSPEDYQSLRDRVFSEDPSPAQIKRLVRDHQPESYEARADETHEKRKKTLALAERLQAMVREDEATPERVVQALEIVVGGLRQLVEE
ncbi:MAG: hypothetical protein HY791_40150 [Deltaproteobacteria bacterium]|nr:hypothetical protein [Deltaproteobacteria bacterium]